MRLRRMRFADAEKVATRGFLPPFAGPLRRICILAAVAVAGLLGEPGLQAAPRGADNLDPLVAEPEDLAKPEEVLLETLARRRAMAPGSMEEAGSLEALGELALQSGDFGAAEQYHLGAMKIRSRLAPLSLPEADSQHALARVYRGADKPEMAMERGARAVEILRYQRESLADGSLSPAHYSQIAAAIFKTYIQLLLSAGEERLAFENLEQYRASVFAALVRQRPPWPEAPDLERVQAHLEGDGALVSYLVLESKTFLFVLAGGSNALPLRVFELPVGEAELLRRVEAFRLLLHRDTAETLVALVGRGRRLHATLLGPAAPILEGRRRLLILPDGPLHLLPFSALRTDTAEEPAESREDERYLIQTYALRYAASAMAEVELDAAPGSKWGRGSGQVAIFADPSSGAPGSDSVDRGGEPSLPPSRAEAREIANLFPGRSAVYLGDEATEENAKAIPAEVRYLHFATQALLDERHPLDSYLALSRSAKGGSDGRLQAWEVIEEMRLDAELVVLSACGTGSRQELGGEGLIGLARAFQVAGARSVLASLWEVSDQASSALMIRYYRYLRGGLRKDEALRAAQQELLLRPVALARSEGSLLDAVLALLRGERKVDLAHPSHWAAFRLVGEGR